jgi:hypothetical protein
MRSTFNCQRRNTSSSQDSITHCCTTPSFLRSWLLTGGASVSSYLSSVYFYCVYGCLILSIILAGRSSSRPHENFLFIVVVDGGAAAPVPLSVTVKVRHATRDGKVFQWL